MNIQKKVEEYIVRSKSIKDCLKNKLINYSALSRKISKELNISEKNFDAVLVSCRRYAETLRKKKTYERKIIELLKESSLEIKNKVSVIVIEKTIFSNSIMELTKNIRKKKGLFRTIEGINSITIITNDEFINSLKDIFKNTVLSIKQNLIEVTIKSSENLETTPGVMAYLYSLFGEREINIIETMSCWTDTMFVIEEKDLTDVMNLLKF